MSELNPYEQIAILRLRISILEAQMRWMPACKQGLPFGNKDLAIMVYRGILYWRIFEKPPEEKA